MSQAASLWLWVLRTGGPTQDGQPLMITLFHPESYENAIIMVVHLDGTPPLGEL
jgi:hypothetical protein